MVVKHRSQNKTNNMMDVRPRFVNGPFWITYFIFYLHLVKSSRFSANRISNTGNKYASFQNRVVYLQRKHFSTRFLPFVIA